MANLLVVDTNVLWSFAVVGRLDLLEVRFAGRLVWTDAVRGEIIRNVSSEPRLQAVIESAWLGEPVEFAASDLLAISRLRGILATPGDHPAMHLGEAESIYLIQSKEKAATFVTDDGPAADLVVTIVSSSGIRRRWVGRCWVSGFVGVGRVCPGGRPGLWW